MKGLDTEAEGAVRHTLNEFGSSEAMLATVARSRARWWAPAAVAAGRNFLDFWTVRKLAESGP